MHNLLGLCPSSKLYYNRIMDERGNLHLLILYAIEKGYLPYLPQSIPAVREVSSLVREAFNSYSSEVISGHYCVHKDYIQRGVRSRVLKILGSKCVLCGEENKIQVHHIKPHWRTWNNSFGLTVLCETHHKMIRSGIGKTKAQVISCCSELKCPSSTKYDPPDDKLYPESMLVKLPRYSFYYYW